MQDRTWSLQTATSAYFVTSTLCAQIMRTTIQHFVHQLPVPPWSRDACRGGALPVTCSHCEYVWRALLRTYSSASAINAPQPAPLKVAEGLR
jgi:hypothetical protein